MMKFPNLVYISPGPHQCPGGTFQYLQVIDDADLLTAIAKGYYPTPELAVQQPADFNWAAYAEAQGWAPPESPKEITNAEETIQEQASTEKEVEVLTYVHRGRGKYDVLNSQGKVIMDNMTKKQAEAAGAQPVQA